MITAEVLDRFDAVDAAEWSSLHEHSRSGVFMSLSWQRVWWRSFGRGRLMIVVIRQDDHAVAIAPLFIDGGMAFLVGSGGSDYLEIIGDRLDPAVLARIVETVCEEIPGLIGVRLYHVPDASTTETCLRGAAELLGWGLFDEGSLDAPRCVIGDPRDWDLLANKKSLVRHERGFARDRELRVEHHREGAAIVSLLDQFFEQHVERWAGTPFPSLFGDVCQRDFYRSLAAESPTWLRFTRVLSGDRLIAAHYGFSVGGSYMWYKPSFDISVARRSPGEVLIRHLLLAARDEGATEFDMGLGDEPFKQRFTNDVRTVRTWGLYPRHG